MPRLHDLKCDDLFMFPGRDVLYYCRGNGWYATPKGYDGGPWYKDQDENPEVVLISGPVEGDDVERS